MSQRFAGSLKVNGMKIAYQRWMPPASYSGGLGRIICSHGWMDNSNSFSILGPSLANAGYDVVCFDQIGHGRSSHLPPGISYQLPMYVTYLKGFIASLGWGADSALSTPLPPPPFPPTSSTPSPSPPPSTPSEKTSPDVPLFIVGHSMGATISMLLVGAFPTISKKLVLLEGFGPITSTASKAPTNLRRAVEAELNAFSKPPPTPRAYKTVGDAVAQRMKNVSTYPGKQWLSQEATLSICSRGLSRFPYRTPSDAANNTTTTSSSSAVTQNEGVHENNDEDEEEEDLTDLTAGPVYFRHDSRLLMPSFQYASVEQVLAYIESISSSASVQTLFVQAESGWPLSDAEAKYQAFGSTLTHTVVEGSSHHLHLDPQTAHQVAAQVIDFLKK